MWIYRVVHKKKTGDFSRQPQIASGQIIYQNVGNFLEIMCAKFGGIRCYRRLAVPEKLPEIGPKSRFTSGLWPEARIHRRKNGLECQIVLRFACLFQKTAVRLLHSLRSSDSSTLKKKASFDFAVYSMQIFNPITDVRRYAGEREWWFNRIWSVHTVPSFFLLFTWYSFNSFNFFSKLLPRPFSISPSLWQTFLIG